ncbi:DNA/RNA nuclease SfsA [Leptolyngbya ohadii]|uniref:DNA/RNA nuclease SfsA n=1 Tax=Leptolyngbya ohadii TaxID=1962290 RepID=UPI000B598B23|nr:DNA/RNA nuclease SfsA [Leptolyngbya ohadii]
MPPSDWIYPFPPLLSGTLIKRYKRFFADIELDTGETIVAHCPNTGPMTGVYVPGNRVMVSVSDNPTRKLPYTWELIEVENGVWAGTNTALPNRVVESLLLAKVLPELGDYQQIQREVPYGQDKKSRIDFLLTAKNQAENTERPIFIEVKNTTWARGTLALFPDTVTTRGQKHLQELMALTPQARAVMLYFINRGDCTEFAPGDTADPVYGQLLRQAIDRGVEVLPCRFDITPQGVRYLGLAEFKIAAGMI